MDLLVGTSSLSGQFPHGVPSFSLIDSELYHAISGKTTSGSCKKVSVTHSFCICPVPGPMWHLGDVAVTQTEAIPSPQVVH